MSAFWSTFIQKPEELHRSRELRFRDDNHKQWLRLIGVKNGQQLLEVGCGSGLFCHRIKTYCPGTEVTGLDRDEVLLSYARERSKALGISCRFVAGETELLPFEDGSFDLCFSHTVMNFCEPSRFLSEQRRVLRLGGRVAVLNVVNPPNRPELWVPSDGCEEKALFDRLWAAADQSGAGKFRRYAWSVEQTCRYLDEQGFQDISVDILSVVSSAPDSAHVDSETATAQIEENRLAELCSVEKARHMAPDALSDEEYRNLVQKIHRRYDRLLEDYRLGVRHWECEICTVAAISGRKAG